MPNATSALVQLDAYSMSPARIRTLHRARTIGFADRRRLGLYVDRQSISYQPD